jgi:hypothetical protein
MSHLFSSDVYIEKKYDDRIEIGGIWRKYIYLRGQFDIVMAPVS